MALGTLSTGGKDPAGRPMGSVIASTRGNFQKSRHYCALFLCCLDTAMLVKTDIHRVDCLFSGVKYFGGGPVVSTPFAWYHVCLTVNYLPSKDAER